MSFLGKLKAGLAKTRTGFVKRVTELVARHPALDEEFFAALEEILIQADVGARQAEEIIARVRKQAEARKLRDANEIEEILKAELAQTLNGRKPVLNWADKPSVILVVGVNGTGKTTTIGKLAFQLGQEGKKVLLAAADTFRAAATEQLEIWAKRARAELIKHQSGGDPAAVVYDALEAALSRHADVVLIDTAGRLQTKVNLMEELKKIKRVAARIIPGAPQEVLLVLDATTGQNALSQAKVFTEALGVTGIVLTKLDGTARGGIVVAIKATLGIPVKLIGVGEKIEDLSLFDANEFVEALFSKSA